jgi:hypothetical protein
MEALIKKIAEKAGIDEAKAKLAAEAAIEFIEQRVAKSIDEKVADAVQTMAFTIKSEVHEAVTGEPATTMMQKLTTYAEGAKDKLGDFAEGAKDKLEDFAEGAQKTLGSFAKKAGSLFGFGGSKEGEKEEKEEKEEEKKS